jgi:hypothetical protein
MTTHLNRATAKVIILTCLVTLGSAAIYAQAPTKSSIGAVVKVIRPQVLGNLDVIKMAAAGLSDDLVIGVIQRAERTSFDTSSEALIKLKTAKVSDAVIMAMLDPEESPVSPHVAREVTSKPNPTKASISGPSIPKGPAEAGIYMANADSASLTLLEPTLFSEAKSNSFVTRMTAGIAKMKMRAVVRSPRASIRTTSQQPVFYFNFENKSSGLSNSGGLPGWMSAATSPNEFVLVQMYEKSNARELIMGEANAFSQSSGTRSEDTVPFRIERLAPGYYKVTPTEVLGPGEFCFFYAGGAVTLGTSTPSKLFDFGVDQSRE